MSRGVVRAGRTPQPPRWPSVLRDSGQTHARFVFGPPRDEQASVLVVLPHGGSRAFYQTALEQMLKEMKDVQQRVTSVVFCVDAWPFKRILDFLDGIPAGIEVQVWMRVAVDGPCYWCHEDQPAAWTLTADLDAACPKCSRDRVKQKVALVVRAQSAGDLMGHLDREYLRWW